MPQVVNVANLLDLDLRPEMMPRIHIARVRNLPDEYITCWHSFHNTLICLTIEMNGP